MYAAPDTSDSNNVSLSPDLMSLGQVTNLFDDRCETAVSCISRRGASLAQVRCDLIRKKENESTVPDHRGGLFIPR